MAHVESIEKNRSTLLRCININVQVVACLRSADVIDESKESRLEAEKAPYDKLRLLIDWIKESTETIYESFLQVMEENEQQHVANLLKGKTEDNHVPLSPDRYARLVRIRPKLMRMIHNNVALIAALKSSNAISETDVDDLSADKGPNYRKNFHLINAILRRSDYSFELLHDALLNTHHQGAADYLKQGEVIAVHVNTTRPDLDEDLSESLNVALMIKSMAETTVKELQTNESMDETTAKEIQSIELMTETTVKEIQIPQLNGLTIVGASPRHSIVILVYCKTTDNIVTFSQLFNSGELQTFLEDILNRVLTRIEPKSTEILEARIRLDEEEIFAIEEITGIEDWIAEQSEKTETDQSGRLLAVHDLTQVEVKTTTETLSEEHANRIRCQYNQLLNNLTSVPDIVAQMFQRHKLSDKEREHLQQFHSTPIRASEELLNIIIGKSPDVYQCFLESLQTTKQHLVYQLLSSDQQNETTSEQI